MSLRKYGQVLGVVLGGVLANAPLQAQSHIIKQALTAFDKEEFAQAQALIDQATQDEKAQTLGSTWYYRGAIYEQCLRNNIASDTAAQYLEEALRAYHQVLALTPKSSQYHSFAQANIHGLWAYYLGRGVRYYKAEAFDRAIEHFEVCKQIKPDDPYALLYIAIAAHQDENYALARQHYEQYLQVGEANPAVYRGLANIIAHHCQDLDKARTILDQAIQQYPWDDNLLEEEVQLLRMLHQLAASEKQLQEQLATAPSHPVLYYQLGYLYEQWNKPAEALVHYQKAAELAPQQLEPICQLGVIHYNQASQVMDSTADMSEEAFQEQGKELQEKWNFHWEQALAYFERARKLRRHDLFILKRLHTLYTCLNMPAKAKRVARAMRRIKGGHLRLEADD